MTSRLENALRTEDFRAAFSIAASLSTALAEKAAPRPNPVSIDEEIRTMESALSNVGPGGAPLIRSALAVRALKTGDVSKAKIHAEMAIAEVGRTQYPNSSAVVPETLHIGYIVLGTVALRSGDMASAKQALRNAGNVSPGASTFPGPQGPDFSLAEALFERGESGATLEYLASVRAWWAAGSRQLDQWSAAIKGGGQPLFPRSGRGL